MSPNFKYKRMLILQTKISLKMESSALKDLYITTMIFIAHMEYIVFYLDIYLEASSYKWVYFQMGKISLLEFANYHNKFVKIWIHEWFVWLVNFIPLDHTYLASYGLYLRCKFSGITKFTRTWYAASLIFPWYTITYEKPGHHRYVQPYLCHKDDYHKDE